MMAGIGLRVARKPRENVVGGLYHVFARGNARGLIYLDDADRWSYLSLLRKVTVTYEWACLAYCLMANHLHLLIETPSANLSEGMRYLHGRYALRFNQRHSRVGHVFQGRYGATRIAHDRQLAAAFRYIALNPVEAGVCRRPEDWPWGSAASAPRGPAGGLIARDRLRALLGAEPSLASDPAVARGRR